MLSTVLFSENFRKIFVNRDVKDFDLFILNRFSDSVLVDLDMTEVLGRFRFRPENTRHIIVVDFDWLTEEFLS